MIISCFLSFYKNKKGNLKYEYTRRNGKKVLCGSIKKLD